MSGQIFRKKSLERVASPENLNDYIKISSIGAWLILTAVIVLLVGCFVWGIVGRIQTKITTAVVSDANGIVCYISADDEESLITAEDPYIEVDGVRYEISSVSSTPVAVDESLDEYAVYAGGFSSGDWIYVVNVEGTMAEGSYDASLILDSVAPISFLVN